MTQSTNVSSSLSSSSIPLASLLVARFLRSNNYAATLDTFIREAGLPPDAGSTSTSTGQGGRGGTSEYDDWTLEGVIQEKKTFDQSLRFERYGGGDNDDDRRERWSVPGEFFFFYYAYNPKFCIDIYHVYIMLCYIYTSNMLLLLGMIPVSEWMVFTLLNLMEWKV